MGSRHYNAYLVRMLLLSAAKQLLIVVADPVADSLFNANKDDPVRTFIDSSYRVMARTRGNATQPGVIVLQRRGPPDADAVKSLLRFLIDHPQARLVNAWREALIVWGTDQGRRLSKREVRRVIERQRLSMIHAHSYLSELSLSDLRALVIAVEQTLAALVRGIHGEEPEYQLADPQSERALAATDFVGFYRAYQIRWVAGMCALLDLPIPPEEECLDLAYRALGWITRRIQAALPGAVEAILLLHRQGYGLHTASGSCSLEMTGAFEGMDMRHCFGRLYGADLIHTFKEGPEYYARLFADAGVQPVEALVVDDSADATRWAAQLGARTILIGSRPHPETGTTPRLESLAELPTFLRQWR